MSVNWLLENAAPVVRYKTLTELAKCDDNALLQSTLDEVLELPQMQKRLALLRNLNFSKTHGSPAMYLENTLPMLSDFGLYYGMDAFDNEIPSIEEVAAVVTSDKYDKTIAYPFLIRSKFPFDCLFEYVVERIGEIYDFTQYMNHDIYDDSANYKSMPENFRGRRIIKPEIDGSLPLIYDIVAMAAIYNSASADVQTKIDNIIEYIISPGYDAIESMYGIRCAAPRKYYAKGWACNKPFNDNKDYSNANLHRLLLYSNFPVATKSVWYKNAIDFLSQYKTDSGTYIFPKEYLIEADGNWVLGTRMSLAENRRKQQWLEVESTFYMQKLLAAFNTVAEENHV